MVSLSLRSLRSTLSSKSLISAKRPMATSRVGSSLDSSYGLVTYAMAPAPVAFFTRSVWENAVSMTTGAMFSSQIMPAAVMPSIRGILTSMHTTSGRYLRVSSTASSPLAA